MNFKKAGIQCVASHHSRQRVSMVETLLAWHQVSKRLKSTWLKLFQVLGTEYVRQPSIMSETRSPCPPVQSGHLIIIERPTTSYLTPALIKTSSRATHITMALGLFGHLCREGGIAKHMKSRFIPVKTTWIVIKSHR